MILEMAVEWWIVLVSYLRLKNRNEREVGDRGGQIAG